MRIEKVITTIGLSGYYNKDFKATSAGAKPDNFVFEGEPVTEGFYSIIQPGECISVILMLEDGQIAWGDCVDVVYAGSAGRDPLFRAKDNISIIKKEVAPVLIGKDLGNFRSIDNEVDNIKINGKKLHTALRYGVSQAILDAVAKAKKITMAEVISQEYKTTISTSCIPLLASAPQSHRVNIDKMILKEAAMLPHGVYSNVEEDVGLDGSKLINDILWIKRRIQKIGREGYRPVFHFDMYGSIGKMFNDDVVGMASFLEILRETTEPYNLFIECPIIASNLEDQINIYKKLCSELEKRGIGVKIIVDEGCNTLEDIKAFSDAQACDYIQIKTPDLGALSNTIESVLYCKRSNVGAYIGGSVNETDKSARVCSQIALATQADFLIAKPGHGNDESIMIETNEMKRTLEIIKSRG